MYRWLRVLAPLTAFSVFAAPNRGAQVEGNYDGKGSGSLSITSTIGQRPPPARIKVQPGSTRPKFTTLAKESVEIPAQRVNGYLAILGKVNDRGPYLFLVDTGSSTLFLTPDIARKSRVVSVEGKREQVVNAAGQDIEVQRVFVKRFATDGFTIEATDAGVLTDEQTAFFSGLETATPIGGLLGLAVFSDCVVELDYPNKRLLLHREAPSGLDEKNALEMAENNPEVLLTINGAPVRALIDSGSDTMLDLPREPRWPRIFSLNKKSRGVIGGSEESDAWQLDGNVVFGSLTIENPIVHDSYEAIVGNGVLQFGRLVIDARERRLWFLTKQARSTLSVKTNFAFGTNLRRQLGFQVARKGKAVLVEEIIPDGPAEKSGLRAGDEIVTVNGLALNAAFPNFEATAGHVRLGIVRNEAPQEIDLQLAEP